MLYSEKKVLGGILTAAVAWWIGDQFLLDALTWPSWGVALVLVLATTAYWVSLEIARREEILEAEFKNRASGAQTHVEDDDKR